MFQRWEHLLFLHWRFDPSIIQATLPPGLTVDTFDGKAWVGIVPFSMRNIRPWWSPVVPGVSNFLELNLRTYAVDRSGNPGVWFYSLDCNQPIAVWWARRFYSLPYFHSRMSSRTHSAESLRVSYQSGRRTLKSEPTCRFDYEPRGSISPAQPGTLEFFLIERYLLFAQNHSGQLLRGRVFHAPYQIQDVKIHAHDEHLLDCGDLRPESPLAHAKYSPGVDVEVFPLDRIT